MNKFFPLLLSSCCLATAVLFAAPIRSSLGADGMDTVSPEDPGVPYITDGLIAIQENIPPPATGTQSILLDTPIDTTKPWTLELCGDYLGIPQRDIVFLCVSQSSSTLHYFGIGLWIKADNSTINGRVHAAEGSLRQTIDNIFHVTYTIDPNSLNMIFYGNGKPVWTPAKDRVSTALTYIQPQVKYLVAGANQHCYIRSIRVYDRVLTEEEVEWNYQIDKERFGL